MKIKMLTSIAGDDFALSPGEITDRFSDAECGRMIEAGSAVPFIEDKIERSVKKQTIEKRG